MKLFNSIESIVPKKIIDLKTFKKVADLIYFEGPLLSHLVDKDGEISLLYWLDREDNNEIWALFKVKSNQLESYLDGVINLKSLINESIGGLLHVLEISQRWQVVKEIIINSSDLPSEYLPLENSFLQPEFRPERISSFVNSLYRIEIKRTLELRQFLEVTRLYGQIYSFMFYSTEDQLLYNENDFAYAVQAFPWAGGYSAVNFYKKLASGINQANRPKLSSIVYASPGWLELKLETKVAREIRELMYVYAINRSELEHHYKELQKYLVDNGLSSRNSKSNQYSLLKMQENFLRQNIFTFGVRMGLKPRYVDTLAKLSISSLQTTKLILSIYRRVRDLYGYEERDFIRL